VGTRFSPITPSSQKRNRWRFFGIVGKLLNFAQQFEKISG